MTKYTLLSWIILKGLKQFLLTWCISASGLANISGIRGVTSGSIYSCNSGMGGSSLPVVGRGSGVYPPLLPS